MVTNIKQGELTRKRILAVLRLKNRTMAQLSEDLNLSPSTICDQVHHLEASGLIRQNWPRALRNKYYELVP